MTAKVTVELKSDLTGKPATETRVFSKDGATATIHLTEAEAGNFDKVFDKYMSKASDVQVSPDVLREYARANGLQVGDRGRIAASVLDAYLGRTPADEPAEQVSDESGE